ncbi:hypothetical protein ACN9M1_27515 (plasmid) [Ralstonia sp. R-29]|uniref:hypothetical protein n=1 Tax=Ralstonia sp. R-29 TaxID=3404059 RepID=UPI003CF3C02B
MKPFITNASEGGRYLLRLQTEGVHRDQIADAFSSRSIVAYALPEGHTLKCAWQCRIFLDNNDVFEFSSACTEVAGWQEVGSLNIERIRMVENSADAIFRRVGIENFAIVSVDCLVYETPDVYAECGIVLRAISGEEVIIAAGVSHGSVSVQAPFSSLPFDPEFSLPDYTRAKF